MAVYEANRAPGDRASAPGYGDATEIGWENSLRLGQDVRFVLVAVGGGAIRIGREIARRHVRHLETVAINCDPKVQGFDEFDRRVYLGPDSGTDVDTGGSPYVGGTLARAAEPVLERIFRGAHFVIVVGSLGGGAGSGAFPFVLDVAARHSEVVSAFVVKPFRCEAERRALADRAIGRLPFLESFGDKKERGLASLQTLDNESLIGRQGRLPFRRVTEHWADVIETHIEKSFLAPAEAILETVQLSPRSVPIAESTPVEMPAIVVGPVPLPASPEIPPILPAAHGAASEVELTFEIEGPAAPTTPR